LTLSGFQELVTYTTDEHLIENSGKMVHLGQTPCVHEGERLPSVIFSQMSVDILDCAGNTVRLLFYFYLFLYFHRSCFLWLN